MADCLMYWKTYWDDIYNEDPDEIVDIHWHTNSESFFQQVEIGDSLWVTVWAGSSRPEEWRLLEKIRIKELKEEEPDDNYRGPYHAIGDQLSSLYFDIKRQSDFTPILHELEFISGRKIKANGKLIGRSLQAIRPLTDGDIELLERYSANLKRREFKTPKYNR